MRTRISLSILVFFITVALSHSQRPLPTGLHWRTAPIELQFGAGTTHYFGDIGGTTHDNNWLGVRDFEILRSRPAISGAIRFFHSKYLSYGASASMGWLSGSDLGGRNELRDYVFNTFIFEPAGRVEYYPLRDLPTRRRGIDSRGMVRNYTTISAYVFAGAGVVLYRPMPNDNLRQRRERADIQHGSVTMVLPAGIGAKFGIRSFVDLGVEIGGRYTMSDYLDGFTSPAAQANDIYYITTISLVYRLGALTTE